MPLARVMKCRTCVACSVMVSRDGSLVSLSGNRALGLQVLRVRPDPRRLALTCADVLVLSVRRSLANGVAAGKVAQSNKMACGTGMSIHARLRDDHYRAGRRLQEARISVPTVLRQQQSL